MLKFNKDKTQVISVENQTIVRILAVIGLAVLAVYMLAKVITPLTLIIVAFFLAIALNPIVSAISNKLKIKSRAAATGVAYVGVIGLIVIFVTLVFPPLIDQTITFAGDVPEKVQNLKDTNTPTGNFIHKYGIDKQIDSYSKEFSGQLSNYTKTAIATAGKIGTTIINVVVVLVLAFMMIVEGPVWLDKYFNTLSAQKRKYQKSLFRKWYKIIVGYVNGQVTVAFIGAVFTTIALFITSQILHVQVNPIALGGIIFMFALLPLIGTTLGAIIVVLACALVSLPLALIMIGFFLIYQQLENVTIQPYIQSRSNTLTPLLVLIAALIGVGVGGILGALLAIPVAGCIKVILDEKYALHNESGMPKAEIGDTFPKKESEKKN